MAVTHINVSAGVNNSDAVSYKLKASVRNEPYAIGMVEDGQPIKLTAGGRSLCNGVSRSAAGLPPKAAWLLLVMALPATVNQQFAGCIDGDSMVVGCHSAAVSTPIARVILARSVPFDEVTILMHSANGTPRHTDALHGLILCAHWAG